MRSRIRPRAIYLVSLPLQAMRQTICKPKKGPSLRQQAGVPLTNPLGSFYVSLFLAKELDQITTSRQYDLSPVRATRTNAQPFR
jgi:hypothetical protein